MSHGTIFRPVPIARFLIPHQHKSRIFMAVEEEGWCCLQGGSEIQRKALRGSRLLLEMSDMTRYAGVLDAALVHLVQQ